MRLNDLTLQKAVDTIKAAEQTQQQVKLMSTGEDFVNTLRRTQQEDVGSESKQSRKTRYLVRNRQQGGLITECGNCGMTHDERNCPAFGKRCFNCEKMNHFARKCRGKNNKVGQVNQTTEVEQKPEEDRYCISSISDGDEPKARKAVINLQISKPEAENTVQFQIDTGSQCDILPISHYIQVTGDNQLQRLQTCKKEIVSYTGERRKIAGKAKLPVWFGDQRRTLNFNIINRDYQPVLSLDTSIALGVVNLSKCDILALTIKPPEDNSSVREEYADVFDGLGEIPGAHTITIEDTVKPVIHAPRRVPVALRSKIKVKLDESVDRGVIVPVTEPTRWVSSMLAVVKPNKIRICIDPRDLNRVIRRQHYQLPTVDEVTSRLTGAKKFTLCDAKDGFHQIKLDTPSSYLTTFNSPFGRYGWTRMPFGISSAPEVWQRRMHEFAQDLSGVEVIADDFLIAGFGETEEEVDRSLEANERAFFQKCREWNLKLNKLKMKRSQTEVHFMGHLITADGLKADPAKVQAILDMPAPTDIKGLKRFLGMVNYLAKFLPLLSDMTEPLRRLEDKDVEWCWLEQHQQAYDTVKKSLAKALVLRYYDVSKEVTIECDASDTGLGAVLMQDGQPVVFD